MKELDKVEFNSEELKIDRTPITRAEINSKRTLNGGFTRKTVEAFGVPFPPPSGWIDALVKYGYPLFKFQHVAKVFVEPPTKKLSKKAKRKLMKEQRAVIRKKLRDDNVAYHKRHGLNKPAKATPSSYIPPKSEKAEFYLSWDWRTLRKQVLNEFGSVCQCCGATPQHKDISGRPVRIVVDHIKPLSRYWHLRLERSNLQVLCDECNQGAGAWDETDHRPKPVPDEWIIEDEIPEIISEQLKIRH